MPLNILHLLGTAQPEGRGIARIVAEIAAGLDPSKYRVHAWFLGPPGPLTKELFAAGAHVRVINWHAGSRDPIGAWRFWRCLQKHRFALVHQHFGARSIRHLLHLTSKARLIVHVHESILEPFSDRHLPVAVRGANVVIAVSQAVASQIPTANPVVVHSGIRVPQTVGYKPRASSTVTVIGTACRLVPLKGLLYLIEATVPLFLEFPQLRLEIAGDGYQRNDLENQVERFGLKTYVKFLGWQADLGDILQTWDIFALPSLSEGFGLVVLEAMAAGLPVVGTSVGGLPELIQHGHTGYVVRPAKVFELTERLRDLVCNRELRTTLGAAGRERARTNFSIDRMLDQIKAVYDAQVRHN